MKKSFGLLKREYEHALKELQDAQNTLKEQIYNKDIVALIGKNYCDLQSSSGKTLEVELSEQIFAMVIGRSTNVCIQVDDEREGHYCWTFDINIDGVLPAIDCILMEKDGEEVPIVITVSSLEDDEIDENVKDLIQQRINEFEESLEMVRKFDIETGEYTYSSEAEEVKGLRNISEILAVVQGRDFK